MSTGSLTKRRFLAVLGGSCVGGLAGVAARWQDPAEPAKPASRASFPRTIVLVRHAERAAEPSDDPGLSPAGEERAERLGAMLAGSGVTHLFASQFARTQRTLEPLAKATGVRVQQVEAGARQALLRALAALPRGAVAVVAGHSNTVPPLLAKLAPDAAAVTIADDEYDRLLVVTQCGEDGAALVLPLRY